MCETFVFGICFNLILIQVREYEQLLFCFYLVLFLMFLAAKWENLGICFIHNFYEILGLSLIYSGFDYLNLIVGDFISDREFNLALLIKWKSQKDFFLP